MRECFTERGVVVREPVGRVVDPEYVSVVVDVAGRAADDLPGSQAEEQRQGQPAETDSPQRAQQPDPTPVRVTQTTADSNDAESVDSRRYLALRVAGIAIMAVCALSILGILIHYRVRRP